MLKHKNKIITGVVIAVVLALVFWYGGNAPALKGEVPQSVDVVDIVESEEISKENTDTQESKEEMSAVEETSEGLPEKEENDVKPEAEAIDAELSEEIIIETLEENSETIPVPEEKPLPVESEKTLITEKELTCTLSVRCDTILKNISWLNLEKVDIVPEDGVIFPEKTVVFYEGESVFNVLLREMKRSKIHLEFENTPIYNSAYIEGIGNLYEFDCGELSGWMYKVNDWFPNYGCSRYQLEAGDKVEWVYTCDLGYDVGGGYSARNGNENE